MKQNSHCVWTDMEGRIQKTFSIVLFQKKEKPDRQTVLSLDPMYLFINTA